VSTPTPVSGEPALILAVISSGVGLLVTFNIGLTSDQAALWIAVITAVFAAATALLVRPVSPAVFSGVVTAAAALLVGYHFHVNPDTVSSLNAVLTGIMMLIVRGHVSPVALVRRTGA
jgi:hypothetical protein